MSHSVLRTEPHIVSFCASFKHEKPSISGSSPRKAHALLLTSLNSNFLFYLTPLHLDFDFKPSSLEPSQTNPVTKNRGKALEAVHSRVIKSIDFEMRETQDEYKEGSDKGNQRK